MRFHLSQGGSARQIVGETFCLSHPQLSVADTLCNAERRREWKLTEPRAELKRVRQVFSFSETLLLLLLIGAKPVKLFPCTALCGYFHMNRDVKNSFLVFLLLTFRWTTKTFASHQQQGKSFSPSSRPSTPIKPPLRRLRRVEKIFFARLMIKAALNEARGRGELFLIIWNFL